MNHDCKEKYATVILEWSDLNGQICDRWDQLYFIHLDPFQKLNCKGVPFIFLGKEIGMGKRLGSEEGS